MVHGVVEEVRPHGLFAVRCDDGRQLLASLGTTGRKTAVKLTSGDRVRIEISPLNPARGRIEGRL